MENQLFDHLSKYLTLTDEEKQAILDLAIFRTYKKGTILLKQGDPITEGYFVIKGCLRCYYMIDGQERTTSFYTENESVMLISSTFKGKSEHYVACIEDSIVTVGSPEMEQIIFEKFPRFEMLSRVLSEDLMVKNQASFDDFKNSSPEQRYLNLLKTKPDLLQRVPQYQLASYLGITPQSLSRIRGRLVNKS